MSTINRPDPTLARVRRIEATLEREITPTWERAACVAWVCGEPMAPEGARCAEHIDTVRAGHAQAARGTLHAARDMLARTMPIVDAHPTADRRVLVAGSTGNASADRDVTIAQLPKLASQAASAGEQARLQRAAEHERIVRARHVPAVVRSAACFNRTPEDSREHDAIRDARARVARGDRSGLRDLALVAESTAAWRAPDAFVEACKAEGARLDQGSAQADLDRASSLAAQASAGEHKAPQARGRRGGSGEARKARRAHLQR